MRKEVIYKLLEQLDGGQASSHMVLMELIQWLDADTIEQFVDDFSRQEGIMGYEQHELCSDCQETHDVNDDHVCEEQPRRRRL